MCAISSCGNQASKAITPFRTIENINAPPRNTKEVLAPLPIIEGMTQVVGYWERLIKR